jgi:phosphohistidine swiveling domain-containing protein
VKPTLWQKVSDEVSLPGPLTGSEQRRLAGVFDASDPASPWRRALARFALSPGPGALLRFVHGVPYFNATALSETLSHGTASPVPGPGGGVTFVSRRALLPTLRLLRTQWKLEAFLGGLPEPPPAGEEAVGESVAIGLAVQLLALRLPRRDDRELAGWLACPDSAPAALRATVRTLLEAQLRRTKLSPAWARLFEAGAARAEAPELPPYFWNEPPAAAPAAQRPSPATRWTGIPICAGTVEGPVVLETEPGSGVLVFAHARPGSVEQFSRASGLVFAEGGALAHACCVAREQGIPAVSGVGRGFLASVRARREAGETLVVELNGATGELVLRSRA